MLDMKAIVWLENYLQVCPVFGPVMCVSICLLAFLDILASKAPPMFVCTKNTALGGVS